MKHDAPYSMPKPTTLLTADPTIEAYQNLENILQKRVLYYSDFDVDVNDWKSEQQTLQIFTKTLLLTLSTPLLSLTRNIGESWIGMLSTVVSKSNPHNPEKSPWEVCAEYALLTLFSKKPTTTRIEELSSYFSFYGYEVADAECFQAVMSALLEECKKAEYVITNMKELEKKYSILKLETAFNNIKDMHKGYSFDLLPSRKRRRTYTILNRAVTPLILASEKMVESLLLNPEEILQKYDDHSLETQMAQMTIEDILSPETQIQRKASRSLNVKRSYLEMHRLRAAPNDVFSVASLKAIFSYLDYESLKFPTPRFVVIRHFAAVVFQVSYLPFHKSIDRSAGAEENERLCGP